MRKRLLASMIAMVLLLSLFPVSALAAERDKGSETPVACACLLYTSDAADE